MLGIMAWRLYVGLAQGDDLFQPPFPPLLVVLGTFFLYLWLGNASLAATDRVFFLPAIPVIGLLLGTDLGERKPADVRSVYAVLEGRQVSVIVTTRRGEKVVWASPARSESESAVASMLVEAAAAGQSFHGRETWGLAPELSALSLPTR